MRTKWWLKLIGAEKGALVLLSVCALSACAPTERVLGDDSAGSAGVEASGGSGGSGAIAGSAGSGGSTAIAGSTGIGGNAGIAGDMGNGGTSAGGAPSPCFAPGDHPELALVAGVHGCGCSSEPAQCVAVDDNGRPHQLSFECRDSVWWSVQDGVCAPAGACVVDGKIYPNGSGLKDPFSCNSCTCDNGSLSCTEIGCDVPCPDGTAPGTQCLQCGPADGCLVTEYKCLPTCTDQTPCADGGYCFSGTCHLATAICG